MPMTISPETRELCSKEFLELCQEKGVNYLIGSHHTPKRVKLFRGEKQIAEMSSEFESQHTAIQEITRAFVPYLKRLKN